MKSTKRAKSRAVKRSVRIDGNLTSVSLENQFWDALKETIRVFVIEHYEEPLPKA